MVDAARDFCPPKRELPFFHINTEPLFHLVSSISRTKAERPLDEKAGARHADVKDRLRALGCFFRRHGHLPSGPPVRGMNEHEPGGLDHEQEKRSVPANHGHCLFHIPFDRHRDRFASQQLCFPLTRKRPHDITEPLSSLPNPVLGMVCNRRKVGAHRRSG